MNRNLCRNIIIAWAALALASCAAGDDRTHEPAPDENAEGAEDAEVKPITIEAAKPATSIIRPDIVAEARADHPSEPLEATVTFSEGADLNETAKQELARIVKADAFAKEEWPIVIRGHSDSTGGDRANILLSRRRAEHVSEWLTAHGVAEKRITVIAMGEQNPIAPNARPDGTPNEAGRAKNRRVEIVVAPPEPQKSEESGADSEIVRPDMQDPA